ncbi:hypothetical protein P43SY_004248 [Pythium insidiosum]|uniref:Uncharacterized protein n=1 Tax=Pythium insidiosum TaxID=114742 RepID=A0AAD5LUF6_PYTIN|nr:hypothetical protein P43SY_004248 [Pythium insidiosum]
MSSQRSPAASSSVEDDVLLLQEALRVQPFMESNRRSIQVWADIAKRLNANPDFKHKLPRGRLAGRSAQARYLDLVEMRHQQRTQSLSRQHTGPAPSEREGLIDACVALAQQRPVHPKGQFYTVRDHVYILREAIARPPQLQQRGVVRSVWEAIAEKMRSNPDFSKPTVTAKAVQRIVRELLEMRHKKRKRNASFRDVDADLRKCDESKPKFDN